MALLVAGPAEAGATTTGATQPAFAGSTLQLALTGPTQAGQILTIHATGRNRHRVGTGRAARYGLELIVTDPEILPGDCLTTEAAELAQIGTVPGGGSLLTYGALDEGAGGRFSIDEPYEPIGSGPLQVCAYSVWGTRPVAWAQANATIVPVPHARPHSLARPVIHRTGGALLCTRGRWANSPATFAYRWRIGNGRWGPRRTGARWPIPRAARGHVVRCTVTASNLRGSGEATSAPLRLGR